MKTCCVGYFSMVILTFAIIIGNENAKLKKSHRIYSHRKDLGLQCIAATPLSIFWPFGLPGQIFYSGFFEDGFDFNFFDKGGE